MFAISFLDTQGESSVYDTPPMTGQTTATGPGVGGNTLIHHPAGEAVPLYHHHTHNQRPPPIVVEVMYPRYTFVLTSSHKMT